MLRINNYGSFFQSYSLRKILSKWSNNVFFIDYKIGLTIAKKKDIKKTKNIVIKFLKYIYYKKKTIKFIKTDEKNSTIYSEALKKFLNVDKKNYHSYVDVLIIGSDEVFNCCQDNQQVGYSLELFGKRNKAKRLISYAASFGNTTLDKLYEFDKFSEIKLYLSKFDAISIRDNNSKEIIDCMFGNEINSFYHLDPVLVSDIETEKWPVFWAENYILVYGYYGRFTERELKMVENLSTNTKLKIFMLLNKQQLPGIFIDAKVEQVPGIFKNAKYVLTDTFHGLIFSMIFKKQFGYFSRAENSNKISSLVNTFKISQRNLDKSNDLLEDLDKPIDFDLINNIREKAKKETENYFSEQLKL